MHLLFDRDELSRQAGRRLAPWDQFRQALVLWWTEKRADAVRRRSLVRLADMEEWQLRDIGLNQDDVDRALARNGIGRDLAHRNQPH